MFLEILVIIGKNTTSVRMMVKNEFKRESPIIQYEITKAAVAKAIPTA